MLTKDKTSASLAATEQEIRRVWFATNGGRTATDEAQRRKASAVVGMLKFFSLYDAVEGTFHTEIIKKLYLKRGGHGAVADALACGCSPATLYRYRRKYVAVYNLLV